MNIVDCYGINTDEKLAENKQNLITLIATEFTDLSLRISYARENIKQLIQQYSFIGTNKIITDVVRDYFIKNFAEQTSWRLTSNKILNFESPINNIIALNNEAEFFKVNVVEYYDNTQYFNILSELPSCIVGYDVIGQVPVVSSTVTTEDTVSTMVINEINVGDKLVSSKVNNKIEYGVISSVNDDFGWIIPSSISLTDKLKYDVVSNGEVISSIQYWNPDNPPTSIFIPSGTIVSSIIPAGNLYEVTSYIDDVASITGLCATYVTEYNEQFWKRDFSQEKYNDPKIKDEILYYEQFFDELKQAQDDELKFEIYTNKIYPLLSGTWETFATSGFLSNSLLSAFQLEYSGQYPGQNLTQNIANKTFTTIAAMPYIPNLIASDGAFQETSLYLAKPFYENIAYYISLMTKEILNMQTYDAKTGYGVPKDGWKQSNIEYKGYNSYYENSNNILPLTTNMDKTVDCDGPWVYGLLQQFLKLYLENAKNISFNKIQEYVETYYLKLVKANVRKNISKQLFAYQHEIFDKQNYKVYDFQYDQWDNQYTLYKSRDFDKFEDCGEIWVRMKNYPLSVPLMNYVKLHDTYLGVYENDPLDTLQCNQHIKYANMFKELCNNAVQFGILKNVIWILGYSSYLGTNNTLLESESQGYLKLCVCQFNQNTNLNTLVIDLTSIKFYSLYEGQDILEYIDEFVGAYFNQYKKSLDFVLYHKQEHINSLDKNHKSPTDFTQIPLRICSYELGNNQLNNYKDINISGYFPGINLVSANIIVDLPKWKSNKEPNNYMIFGKNISGNINDNLRFNTTVNDIDINNNFVIVGSWYENENTDLSTINYCSGILSTGLNNEYISNLTLFNNAGNLEDETLKTSSVLVTGNLIIPEIYKDLSDGTNISCENIWRLNSDYTNVNIAYESINPNIPADVLDFSVSIKSKQTYYTGIVRYICPLLVRQVSNNNVYLTSFKSINCEFDAVEINLNDINDKEGYIIFKHKYPKCTLNENRRSCC